MNVFFSLSEYYKYSNVYKTPYGGKIVYNICGTQFQIHLKDAQLVQRSVSIRNISPIISLCSINNAVHHCCQLLNR